MLSVVSKFCDHLSEDPKIVLDQSNERVSNPISPPPCKYKEGATAGLSFGPIILNSGEEWKLNVYVNFCEGKYVVN